ncbi:uncharacterized protein LOC110040080, partial [Orbicella faveolata]|uniref:uncharacterized protein LOC110040080 n=1 Tax=Orbicella faveolata TaxID=48498 RepID=UPI0009E4F9C0
MKITSKTRVCSKHFKEEDHHSPDRAGWRLLKEGAIPTVFNWAAASKPRREIIRHIERQTKAQLHVAQGELEELRRESERTNREANAALVLVQQELQRHKEKAAAELNIFKFGIERFSTDDDAIKFYTGFCSY